MLSTSPLSTLALFSAVGQAYAAAAPPAAALNARQETGTGKCTDVHIFLAKGNNEPYPGRQGKLVNAICKDLKNCDYEDIVMQNMLPDPYCDSVHEGGTNMVKQIVAYNKKCPDTQLVISGYSQGAHVVGDGLSGGGGVFFQGCVEESVTPLDPESNAAKAVKAIMTFGDTRHTAGQPYNSESGKDSQGLFPRPGDQLARLDKFADVYRDWCVSGDPICAGGDEVNDHLAYFDVFTDDAAKYARGLLDLKDVATGKPDTTAPVETPSSSSGTAVPTKPISAPTSKGPSPTDSSSSLPASTSASTTEGAADPEGDDDTSGAARVFGSAASLALAAAAAFGFVLV